MYNVTQIIRGIIGIQWHSGWRAYMIQYLISNRSWTDGLKIVKNEGEEREGIEKRNFLELNYDVNHPHTGVHQGQSRMNGKFPARHIPHEIPEQKRDLKRFQKYTETKQQAGCSQRNEN